MMVVDHEHDPSASAALPNRHSSTDVLSPSVTSILQATQPWTRLMAIIGFVMAAFMVLAGLALGIAGIVTGNTEAAILLFVYPPLALLYVFPSMYLLRYSRCVRALVTQRLPSQLEAALEAQRSFWKFVGIVTIVSMALSALVIAGAIVFGILAAAFMGS